MASAQAMVPALKELKKLGWQIVTYAETQTESQPEAAALQVFRSADLAPSTPEEYRTSSMDEILSMESPDFVLVGVSSVDNGSEKLALKAAIELGIRSAYIVETWPHRWLEVYGERDIPLYAQASLGMLVDEFSCEYMASKGFDKSNLVATGNPSQDAFIALKQDREKHRQEMRERFGIPQDAVVIQWSVTCDLDDPKQDNPDSPEWLGFYEVDSIIEFLTALRDVNYGGGRPQVYGVIRQKPSYVGNKVRALIGAICPSVIFDNGRDTGNPLLLASDIVVGAATMMVQNAAMLGIPAIYYFPDLCKPDPMIANKLGFTAPLYKRGDLRDIVHDAGYPPNFDPKTLKAEREIDLPADATGNVVKAIRDFLQS